MKKAASILLLPLCMLLFLNSCALIQHKTILPVQWPAEINYMEAVCELNISWNTMQYSGDMSLRLDYPEILLLGVYGPFGDTVFSIEKNKGYFMLKAGNDKITDEKRFFDIFKMTTEDFMNDISIRGKKQRDSDGRLYIQRERYRVTYYLQDGTNKMCWISPEGTMCIKFLEVDFDKGQ